MKQRLAAIVATLMVLTLAFTACGSEDKPPEPTPTTEYTVTIDQNYTNASKTTQTVKSGEKATKPEDPSRSGFNFVGWYKEANATTPFDFAAAISADQTAYACWTIYDYTASDRDLEILGFAKNATIPAKVDIPAKIGHYDVRSIKDWSYGFVYKDYDKADKGTQPTNIEEVTFPSSMRYIGGGSFIGSAKLKKVTFPETGELAIGGMAFKGCTQLTGTLTLSAGVTEIQANAFDTTNVTNAVFEGQTPPELKLLTAEAWSTSFEIFKDCSKLTEVVVPNGKLKDYFTAFSEHYLRTGGTADAWVSLLKESSGEKSIVFLDAKTEFKKGDLVNKKLKINVKVINAGTDAVTYALKTPVEGLAMNATSGEITVSIPLTTDSSTDFTVVVTCGTVSAEKAYKFTVNAGLTPISNAEELKAMAMDGSYYLTADIVADNWVALGDHANAPFVGTLNGKGHKITLSATYPGGNVYNFGIFKKIGEKGVVKNLEVAGDIAYSGGWGGTVCGDNHGLIQNVLVSANLVDTNGADGNIGAVVCNNNGTMKQVLFTGSTAFEGAYVFAGGNGFTGDRATNLVNCFALKDGTKKFAANPVEADFTSNLKTMEELKAAALYSGFSATYWVIEDGKLPTLVVDPDEPAGGGEEPDPGEDDSMLSLNGIDLLKNHVGGGSPFFTYAIGAYENDIFTSPLRDTDNVEHLLIEIYGTADRTGTALANLKIPSGTYAKDSGDFAINVNGTDMTLGVVSGAGEIFSSDVRGPEMMAAAIQDYVKGATYYFKVKLVAKESSALTDSNWQSTFTWSDSKEKIDATSTLSIADGKVTVSNQITDTVNVDHIMIQILNPAMEGQMIIRPNNLSQVELFQDGATPVPWIPNTTLMQQDSGAYYFDAETLVKSILEQNGKTYVKNHEYTIWVMVIANGAGSYLNSDPFTQTWTSPA